MIEGAGAPLADAAAEPLSERLFSHRAAVLLVRNTVVSCLVFAVGLVVLWLLVQQFAVDKVLAAAISFIVANSLHYALGRTWIYRGTTRAVGKGYVYFLVTGVLGLAITTALFAALLQWTAINYLIARVLVSIVAGLVMFVLNATLNFKRL